MKPIYTTEYWHIDEKLWINHENFHDIDKARASVAEAKAINKRLKCSAQWKYRIVKMEIVK